MNFVRFIRHYIWIAPLVLGFLFIGAGIYLLTQAESARNDVLAALAAENIITREDASIPNVRVTNAETARSEMDWLEAFYLEITNGKRYAELERDDPTRELVFELVQLRTSLNLAVVEIRVADLTIALSVITMAAGATVVLFLTPAVFYAARFANHSDLLTKNEHAQRPRPTGPGTRKTALAAPRNRQIGGVQHEI